MIDNVLRVVNQHLSGGLRKLIRKPKRLRCIQDLMGGVRDHLNVAAVSADADRDLGFIGVYDFSDRGSYDEM